MKNRTTKILLAAVSAAMLAGLGANNVWAVNPATVNITVTMAGGLSVTVDGIGNVTRDLATQSPNALVVTGSSVAVKNDSGGLTETFELSSADSTSSGGVWTLVTTTETAPGADAFALQALFNAVGDGVAPTAAEWDETAAPIRLISAAVVDKRYTSTKFTATGGDPDVANGNMNDNSERALFMRLYMPASDGSGGLEQTITLTITAAAAL